MKKTPLPIRIVAGTLLTLLILLSCALPLYTRGETAALIALGHRDKPYVFGKLGPDVFDCSGLVKRVYEVLGYELVHSAQYVAYDSKYQTVERAEDLIVGDLLFFNTVEDNDLCDHVGIWLGWNRFVHASSRDEKVTVSEFDEHWQSLYSWGKHIIEPVDNPQIIQWLHALRDLTAKGTDAQT